MKVIINCSKAVQITEAEIHASVPEYILKAIRQTDNRSLHAYIGLHEGHFKTRNMTNGENIMLTLSEQGLDSAYSKIKIGTPLIAGHRQNTNEPIHSIGSIVGKIKKGQNIIIVCHGENLRQYGAVSVEMQANSFDGALDSVDTIHCFAMLTRDKKPALYNAYKVVEMAAQEVQEATTPQDDTDTQTAEKTSTEPTPIEPGPKPITIDVIKTFIKQNGLIPSQVFNPEDIKNDFINKQEQLFNNGHGSNIENVSSNINSNIPLPATWSAKQKTNSLDASTEEGMNALREMLKTLNN